MIELLNRPTAHLTPPSLRATRTARPVLAPESRAALNDLGLLAKIIFLPVLWAAGVLATVALLGWLWSWIVPVLVIAYYCGKSGDETKAAEAKRISEIACPRARHEAEMLTAVKEIRAAQWF